MLGNARRPLIALICILLGLQVVIMAAGVAGILLVDGVRGYIGGEAHYTRAQQRATAALRHYVTGARATDLAAFERHLRIPKNLGLARIILEHPDLPDESAHGLLEAGGFHAEDIPLALFLFAMMQETALFRPALESWRSADTLIQQLDALGLEIAALRIAGRSLDPAQRDAFLTRIDRMDTALSVHQNAFASAMEANARRLRHHLMQGMLLGTGLLLLVGVLIGRRTLRTVEQSEAELSTSRRRFQDLAECAADWFWETDRNHRFTYLSQRLSGVLETDTTRFLGQTRCGANGEDPNAPMWLEHWQALENHEPIRDFEYDCHRGPSYRRLRISGKPVYDAAGDFLGYRGAGSDVTREYLATLRAVQAKEEAEAANRAKSEFLANMSHELRTPLNAVIGFADVISAQLYGPGSPKYPEYAHDIASGGRHLLQVLNDILDLSKIEAGEMALQRSTFDLREVVEDCVRFMRQPAQVAGTPLDVDVPAELPPIRADRQRVRQMLLNLLSNAIKFSNPGGAIRVTVRSRAGLFTIDVIDQGIGIPPDKLEEVLQPFKQADGSLARRHEGTGLGLALVARFVDLHGGRVHLESAPDAGTRVRIDLPDREEAHAAAA